MASIHLRPLNNSIPLRVFSQNRMSISYMSFRRDIGTVPLIVAMSSYQPKKRHTHARAHILARNIKLRIDIRVQTRRIRAYIMYTINI